MEKRNGCVLMICLGILVVIAGICMADLRYANAQPAIELRYASFFPQQSPFSIADQHWIEKIEKDTNGRVNIKPYWSGTLVSPRECYSEVVSGAADIALFTPAYAKGGMDFLKTQGEFYLTSPSAEASMKVFHALWDKYPVMAKELTGTKLFALFLSDSLHLMTTKPVRSLSDLKGLRLKAPVGMIQVLKNFGAEGLIIPMPELYENLQKGIVDGAFASWETYKAGKLTEVVKFESNLSCVVGAMPGRIMSLVTWNKLPPDIQKIFDASRDWWSLDALKESRKADKEGLELAKKAGIEFTQMPQSDIDKFQEAYNSVIIQSAKELDKKGLPGTSAYEYAQKLLKEAGGK